MRTCEKSRFVTLAVLLAAGAAGCQWNREAMSPPGYATVAHDPRRDTTAAQEYSARGVERVRAGDMVGAEKEFRAALAADVFFGPAHNNLGLVYYKEKKLYLAAWEFQYAAKLMPTKAEPKNNLGMVLESVGRLDEAAKSYEEALKLEPDSTQVTGNLARAYVRSGKRDQRTRELLESVVMKDDRPTWTAWAKDRLVRMGQPTTAPWGSLGTED
jgi:Tfp pilus assembly protein PilF